MCVCENNNFTDQTDRYHLDSNDHLQAISEKDADVKAIRLRSDSGEAAAFDAGMKNSDGDKIIFLSSRKRIDPAGLPKLLNKLDQGFDLVIGWRHHRADSKLNQERVGCIRKQI